MDELKFVARCFGFAAVLLVISQLKTGGVTIENRVQTTLVNSEVADFVNKSAQGGIKLVNTTTASIKAYYNKRNKKTSSAEEVSEENDESSETE